MRRDHDLSLPHALLFCLGSLGVSSAPAPGQAPPPVLDAVETRILSPTPEASAVFGRSIAACGDTLVVGEPSSDLFAVQGGAAYVYHVANGVVTFEQTLLPPVPDRNAFWQFGLDVDVVCGWPIDIIGVAFQPSASTGGAYIYERAMDGTWQLTSDMIPALGVSNDKCGAAIALDAGIIPSAGGDELVYQGLVGCPKTSRSMIGLLGPVSGGAAYLFRRQTQASWGGGALIVPNDTLIPGDRHPGEDFGAAVDLHGGNVLIGAPNDVDGQEKGAAYFYTGSDQRVKLVPAGLPLGSSFGRSVSMDPWLIAIGAPTEDSKGAVYVYGLFGPIDLIAGGPIVVETDARLDFPTVQTSDNFGYAVRVETPFILAGIPNRDVPFSNVGTVALYELDTYPYAWSLLGILQPATMIGGTEQVSSGGVALSLPLVFAGAPEDSILGPTGSTIGRTGAVFAWNVKVLQPLFQDGFESGNLSAWSTRSP